MWLWFVTWNIEIWLILCSPGPPRQNPHLFVTQNGCLNEYKPRRHSANQLLPLTDYFWLQFHKQWQGPLTPEKSNSWTCNICWLLKSGTTTKLGQRDENFLSKLFLLEVIPNLQIFRFICVLPFSKLESVFYNSAISKHVVRARIVVEMGSHPTKRFLFNHTTPFLTKGLEKSLCDFTGTGNYFCAVWEPCLLLLWSFPEVHANPFLPVSGPFEEPLMCTCVGVYGGTWVKSAWTQHQWLCSYIVWSKAAKTSTKTRLNQI